MDKKDKTNKEEVLRRAEQKILANIYYIYENVNVEKQIIKIRKKFLITDYYFTDFKVQRHPKYYPATNFEEFKDMNSIIISTLLVWADISLKNRNKLEQIIENIGKEKYELWQTKISPKFSKSKINFVFNEMLKYFTNQNVEDIDKPMRLNPRIWGSIIVAKVFEIPPEKIIKSMKSILKNYFPTVDETMNIQFNEMTSTEDLKYIWSESKVEKLQEAYSKNLGIIQKEPYINHDLAKRAYEIKTDFPEISRQDIINSLREEGYDADKNIEPYYLTIILRKYREFINQ
jgi:hypothetical protein